MYVTITTPRGISSFEPRSSSALRRTVTTRIQALRRSGIAASIDLYLQRISESCEELAQDDVWVAGWTPESGWRVAHQPQLDGIVALMDA